ncbi:MAG: PTS sugar transporter subunit IIA [Chthoniobacterales bacterium]|nr:PTS sugar transporter subunit IIA [Chthoniobacterales bacterium]
MTRILVPPACAAVDVAAGSRDEAAEKAADLLRSDPHIGSWEAFRASIGARQIVDLEGCASGVCLVHGRSDAVKGLAVAVARTAGGSGCCPRLVFVFAIPSAMAEEYLRAIGSLARACRDQAVLQTLLDAPDAANLARRVEKLLA